MLYMFLLAHDPANPGGPETLEAHHAATKEFRARDAYVTSEALQDPDTATTVRIRDGKTLTVDGPFAETREVLGGYYLLDCRDLDEAIEFAAKIPTARMGSVEIRPIQHIDDWEYELAPERRG